MIASNIESMIKSTAALLFVFSAPTGLLAQDLPSGNSQKFGWPLDCTLGSDCWIARYVDRERGPKEADFTCGSSTENDHKGTDITLANLGKMQEGVAVTAAASGTVFRLRNTMPDISSRHIDKEMIKEKECGNALILQHDGGWQTQYCHLKRGSLTVKVGDTVSQGDKIAEVGLSGNTEYPHLHFMVRHAGTVLDPFDGGKFADSCAADTATLWQKPVRYSPVTVLPGRFTAAVPKRDEIWDADLPSLPSNSPALVLTTRLLHMRAGDKIRMIIRDPNGKVFFDQTKTSERGLQFFYQYMGRKKPAGGFQPGTWTGEILFERPSLNLHERQTARIEITAN